MTDFDVTFTTGHGIDLLLVTCSSNVLFFFFDFLFGTLFIYLLLLTDSSLEVCVFINVRGLLVISCWIIIS